MKQFPQVRPKLAFFLLRLLSALVLAAPIIGQNESQPYFSLSSSKTFGLEETPTVELSGFQVAAVQVRVYRVKDPLQFYRKLESPHQFGSTPPERSGKPGFLENVRNWKHALRRQIRLFLRGQFTESVSAHFKPAAAKPEKAPAGSPENYYALTPVLNPDQLVLSFVQSLGQQQSWSSVKVPVRVTEKGVYLVEAVSHGLRAYTIVVKSNLVLVTKVGKQRMLGFVADRASGEPVSGADISVMKRDGSPEVFHTNTDGLAEIKTASAAGTDDLRAVVRKGDDLTLNSLPLWSFGDSARSWSGYIYTDRPVYRPGDTVHFRGILRQTKSPGGYSIPAGQSFAVQIQDPDGKSVYTKHLTANSNGIIHDEFAADRTAALGGYYIQVAGGDSTMTGNFEIQEYKKPEYEVRVTAPARVLQGDKLDISINARYYFGEPVKGAKVEYSVYRTRYFYPFWRDADGDGEADADAEQQPDPNYDGNAGEEVLQAQGQLDDDGNLRVSYPTTVSANHIDYSYRIEARVTDEARREISGTGWAVAIYGTFLVNAEPQRYVYDAGSSAEITLRAFDYDRKPISTPILVSLAQPTRPNRRGKAEWTVISTFNASTGLDGAGSLHIPLPAEGGSYRITISAQSGNGRTVENATYLWVTGAGENTFWGGANSHVLQIVADKKKYRAGETAKLLLIAGKPNTPVLVTVEGHDVRWNKVLRSSSATVSFEYKVDTDDEPGIYVTVQYFREGQSFQGQKRISVPPEHHKLNVQVSTDKPQYQPGQTATYNLKVTTPDGKPAPGTDLSLGVVDEAIYAIRPDSSPDLLKFFYGLEGNGVNTTDSLNFYFSGEAGNRRMMLASSTVALHPLAQLKREPLVQPKIRKIFPDTSFWAADITTDPSGNAQAKVSFPDSLTTWRSTVKGVTPTDRFGGAVLKTVVRKNLIMRLSVPRFFVQGDEVVISGIVQNYLASAKHARVSVDLAGLNLLSGSATQEIDIPSRGEARVDWRVKANGAQATVTGKALTDEESDAIELTLPVRPQGVSIQQSKGGSVAAGVGVNQQITFAPDAEPGSRSISIRLASSAAGSIFHALDFLTSFPYGCVEQTMSSFLPDLMVAKATRSLNGVPPVDQDSLDKKVKAGLDRLYDMQHEDGGWGWWPSDDSHPFMTAYVVAGLAEAKANGVEIKEQALEKGVAWLRSAIRQNSDLQPDLQAYLTYALANAGAADSALASRLYSQLSKLSSYGQALLGLALEAAKDARASDVAGVLERSVSENGDEAWWAANRDAMLDFEADVSPEATAYAVKLLSHQRKTSPLLPKAVLWLVNHRNEGYWWSSSKQTAMVIYGVLDYLKASNELAPDFTATVNVNGRAISMQQFNGGSPVNAPEIFLDESKLQTGQNQISVTTSGKGRLYYSINGTHYSNAARLEKQGAVSLNVLRDYFRLAPSKDGDHIVYDLAPLDGPVASGDVLAVRLTVTGSDWRYLLAEDPIPAGTEFIERDKLYQIRNRPPWWEYFFSRRELHDDHMAIFQTYFSQGQQQYFYLLKVVNPGLFHASPARVRPMYQPGVEATTESRIVEVKQ